MVHSPLKSGMKFHRSALYVSYDTVKSTRSVFFRGDLNQAGQAGKAIVKDHKSNAGGRVKSTPRSPCSPS